MLRGERWQGSVEEEGGALEMGGEDVMNGRGFYVTNEPIGRFQILFILECCFAVLFYAAIENMWGMHEGVR